MPLNGSSSSSGVELEPGASVLFGAVVKGEKEQIGGRIARSELRSVIDENELLVSFAESREDSFPEMSSGDIASPSTTVVAASKDTTPALQDKAEMTIGRCNSSTGLASLPVEILAMIIKLAALAMEPGFGALKISHVCQTFRSIAVHSPRLWTQISYQYYGTKMARLYAERSNHVGLDVEIEDMYCAKESEAMLRAVVPFCEEWRSFSYTGYYSVRERWCVREHRIPMNLPRLEHLEVKDDFDHVYMKYSMPNLKSARFINTIPVTRFPRFPTTLQSIATLSITFIPNDGKFGSDLSSLLTFLRHAVSITHLSLAFEDRFCNFRGSKFTKNPTIPNIDTFSLDVVYSHDKVREDSKRLQKFLNSFDLPNLVHMNLSTRFTTNVPSSIHKNALVTNLLRRSNVHAKFTSLNLTVVEERRKYYEELEGGESAAKSRFKGRLVLDVDCIPLLTSLKLRTNFEIRLAVGKDKRFFPLRRLELDHCPRLTVS